MSLAAFTSEPCQGKLSPALAGHGYFGDLCVSVSPTSPETTSPCIFKGRLHTCAVRVTAGGSDPCCIHQLLQLPAGHASVTVLLCPLSKEGVVTLLSKEQGFIYDSENEYLFLGFCLVPWC